MRSEVVMRVRVSEEFMGLLRRAGYSSLCHFLEMLIERGGVEMGFWSLLPADLVLRCEEVG